MPVRDLEWFAPPLAAPPPVLANRGANGIDGVGATAQGVAAAGGGPGGRGCWATWPSSTTLRRWSVRPGHRTRGRCTLVVVDNGGGGIFDFLPQATALDPARFEQLFGTPQSAEVAAVARGFGLEVAEVGTPAELDGALGELVGREGLAVVRARVPARVENVALHDRIHAAVAHAARDGSPVGLAASGSGRPGSSCRGTRTAPGPAGG